MMTISEASAVNVVLDYVFGERETVDRERFEVAAAELAERANRSLHAGWTADKVASRVKDPGPRSALGAVEVAEALEVHCSHGGAVPWPSVLRPLERWVGVTERARR